MYAWGHFFKHSYLIIHAIILPTLDSTQHCIKDDWWWDHSVPASPKVCCCSSWDNSLLSATKKLFTFFDQKEELILKSQTTLPTPVKGLIFLSQKPYQCGYGTCIFVFIFIKVDMTHVEVISSICHLILLQSPNSQEW